MSNEDDPTDRITHIDADHWTLRRGDWRGHVAGLDLGTDVTIFFYATDEVGVGPRWHIHPYDEVFIITAGNALYTIGDRKIEAREGDVLLGPANVPHKFANQGPGRLSTVDVHLSPKWIQTDLDDPELAAPK